MSDNQSGEVMSEYEKDVRIVINKMPYCNQWSWEVTVNGDSCRGFESNYLNAESEIQDKLREMGC